MREGWIVFLGWYAFKRGKCRRDSGSCRMGASYRTVRHDTSVSKQFTLTPVQGLMLLYNLISYDMGFGHCAHHPCCGERWEGFLAMLLGMMAASPGH